MSLTRRQEQTNVTGGLTEYMFYHTSLPSDFAGSTRMSMAGSCANAYVVFADDALVCSFDDHQHSDCDAQFSEACVVPAGAAHVTILSETLGIDNGMGSGSTRKVKGILGAVAFDSSVVTDNGYVVGSERALYLRPRVSVWRLGDVRLFCAVACVVTRQLACAWYMRARVDCG